MGSITDKIRCFLRGASEDSGMAGQATAGTLYGGRYDAKTIRTRTLQGIVDRKREKEAIDSRTKDIVNICMGYTKHVIEEIDKWIADCADKGEFCTDLKIRVKRYSTDCSKASGLVFSFEVSIGSYVQNSAMKTYEFDDYGQRLAYAKVLANIISAYYEEMGYSITMNDWQQADDSEVCRIEIIWHDKETREFAHKVTEDIEVEAYSKGISLSDILIGK